MVVFRCDSSYLIGSGHLIRCLNLAERLRAMGQTVTFFIKNLEGQQSAILNDKAVPFVLLPTDLSQDEELRLISEARPDWVVVDHYELDADWESKVRKFARVFVIDDLKRSHSCEALLDPNFRLDYKDLYLGKVPSSSRIFLGPGFSLLPLQYERVSKPMRPNQAQKSILVFFGGGDPTGELLKFYNSLLNFESRCQYLLVATKANKFLEKIKLLPKSKNINILISPQDWAKKLCESDFYFGSVGSVTWERFYFGLPGDVVVTADNQNEIAKDLESAGLLRCYGSVKNIDYDQILPTLEMHAYDEALLSRESALIQKIVEQFPDHILSSLFLPVVNIRKARLSDARFLFDLRNLPENRKQFINTEILEFKSHLSWLEQNLANPEFQIYIGELNGVAIGQFRVNSDGDVGVSLDKGQKGLGLGWQLIKLGSLEYRKGRAKTLTAVIRKDNQASQNSFLKAGFSYECDLSIDNQQYKKYVLKI